MRLDPIKKMDSPLRKDLRAMTVDSALATYNFIMRIQYRCHLHRQPQTRKSNAKEKYCKLSEHDLIIYARYFNAISLCSGLL